MRKIPLRTVEFTPMGQQVATTIVYADLMRTILLTAPAGGGISTADGIKGSDISLAIKAAADSGRNVVLIEEADHAFLAGRLDIFRWNFFSEEVADFCKAIRDAPVIDPNAAPEGGSG